MSKSDNSDFRTPRRKISAAEDNVLTPVRRRLQAQQDRQNDPQWLQFYDCAVLLLAQLNRNAASQSDAVIAAFSMVVDFKGSEDKSEYRHCKFKALLRRGDLFRQKGSQGLAAADFATAGKLENENSFELDESDITLKEFLSKLEETKGEVAPHVTSPPRSPIPRKQLARERVAIPEGMRPRTPAKEGLRRARSERALWVHQLELVGRMYKIYLYDSSKRGEAIDMLSSALENIPAENKIEKIEAFLRRGLLYKKDGRLDEAKADHEAALELAPATRDGVPRPIPLKWLPGDMTEILGKLATPSEEPAPQEPLELPLFSHFKATYKTRLDDIAEGHPEDTFHLGMQLYAFHIKEGDRFEARLERARLARYMLSRQSFPSSDHILALSEQAVIEIFLEDIAMMKKFEPNSPTPYLLEANHFLGVGDNPKKALDSSQTAIDFDSAHPDGHILKAEAAAKIGPPDHQVKAINRLYETALNKLYKQGDDVDERKARKAEKKRARTLVSSAYFLHRATEQRQGNFSKQVIDQCDAALSTGVLPATEQAAALFYKGFEVNRQGDRKGALKIWEDAGALVKADSAVARVLFSRGTGKDREGLATNL